MPGWEHFLPERDVAVDGQSTHATSRDSSKKSQSLRVAITSGKTGGTGSLGEFLVFSENILITETVRKEKNQTNIRDKYYNHGE
ncbi:hypothetical protein ACLK1S_03825 [Escherichia coli]